MLSNINLGSALKTAINKALSFIPGRLKRLAKKIMNFLPQSPAKEGPLASLNKVGSGLVKTVGEGIEEGTGLLPKPLKKMGQQIVNYVSPEEGEVGPLKQVSKTGQQIVNASSGKGVIPALKAGFNKYAPSGLGGALLGEGGLLSSIGSKLLTPLGAAGMMGTGSLWAAIDGIRGIFKSKEWLGRKEGSTLPGKAQSLAGGAIGGHDSGWSGAGKNALKWSTVEAGIGIIDCSWSWEPYWRRYW